MSNLEECEKMKVVTGWNHAESEDNDCSVANEEAETTTKEVSDGTEDEGSENHTNNSEGE